MSLNKIQVNATEIVLVDNEPLVNSSNLIKSGGVYNVVEPLSGLNDGIYKKSLNLLSFIRNNPIIIAPFNYDGIIGWIGSKYIKTAESLQDLSLVTATGYYIVIRKTTPGESIKFETTVTNSTIVSTVVYCSDNDITTAIAQYNNYVNNKFIDTIETPADANYVFICFNQQSYIYYNVINEWVLMDDFKFSKKVSIKDITYELVYKNGYMNTSGSIQTLNTYATSNYIDISYIKCFITKLYYQQNVAQITFYDFILIMNT